MHEELLRFGAQIFKLCFFLNVNNLIGRSWRKKLAAKKFFSSLLRVYLKFNLNACVNGPQNAISSLKTQLFAAFIESLRIDSHTNRSIESTQ